MRGFLLRAFLHREILLRAFLRLPAGVGEDGDSSKK